MSLIPTPPPQPAKPVKPPGPPVKMVMRGDLTFHLNTYQGVEYWVVKEPLGQKYYQFPPHVFYILQQLDGTKSIDELIDNYHQEHAPKRITRSELQQLLMRFHRDGLVISDMPGQGTELLKRGRKNLALERLQTFSNVLAIRWRGFDPERILNALLPWTWWIFTKPAVIVTAVFAVIALLSVLMNLAEFQARLPEFQQFFDPSHWYMFVAVLGVTKMLHEFGHGLSCKRLGGECHEIGFMLLVLTPCLYCNVSDSWRLNNKWHRAAIGAAGIYVEVILATIATFVWWFVQPGFIQEVCLQVMLICSISTILFNGNPLLRFDGYYILSDILEIPNMQQKSTKALTTLLGRHWLGLEIPDDQLMPSNRPWAFAMFTVAAFCYRWFILAAIVTFLCVWLEPYGLDSVGKGIAIFAAFGMLLWPSYRLYKYMSVPGRMHQVKKPRFFTILGIVVVLLAMLMMIPFPSKLRCSLIVVPDRIETIYVDFPGVLRPDGLKVQPGELVSQGQVIAELDNVELNLMLSDTLGELRKKIAERDSIRKSANAVDAQADYLDQLATLNAEVQQLRQVAGVLAQRKKRLTLTSDIDGTVLDTPYQHAGGQSDEIPLVDPQPFVSGYNENVTANRQQRFCEVADMSQWQAVVVLTENQVKFAKPGQKVKIKLYADAGHVIESEVESVGTSDRSIKRDNYNVDPQTALKQSQLPDLVAEMVAAHQQTDVQYYARVPLPPDDELIKSMQLKIGMGGQARLITENRSLGARLMWWFNQNFRF